MEDPIVAIATSVGISAINIIRISGKNCIKKINSIFKGKNLLKVDANTINYGYIIYKDEIIDEVLVSVFHSPKSYTTEDMIEINCHGGVTAVNKILEIILELGIRIAQPGEFLKRAFLNGRIDLIEVESVQELIDSKNEVARKLSIKGINGTISLLINNLREELLEIIANIEVNIDYPEYEDAIVVTNKLLKEKINKVENKIEEILNKSREAKIINNGVNVAIIGRPNVGKSSILNALLDEEKAIVTEIEGTTRDIIEGTIVLKGININFIDTAGIRETNNIVEKLGIKRSREVIEKSDLILIVLDYSKKLSKEDKEILNIILDKPKIIVLNKIDLNKSIEYNGECVELSTLNKIGIDNLKNKIIEILNLHKIETSDFTYLSNVRQINLLKESEIIVRDIKKSIEKNIDLDLIEIDIKNLWNKLGEIIGDVYEEELLEKIFSNFCLGK